MAIEVTALLIQIRLIVIMHAGAASIAIGARLIQLSRTP